MSMQPKKKELKEVKMWKIEYTTPKGSEKHVLWRGPSATWASTNWLKIAAPGTTILSVEPYRFHIVK